MSLTSNYFTHIAHFTHILQIFYITHFTHISRSKGKQTKKCGQSIEYNKKKYEENDAGRLLPDLSLFFKNALYEVKASGLQLSFNLFR